MTSRELHRLEIFIKKYPPKDFKNNSHMYVLLHASAATRHPDKHFVKNRGKDYIFLPMEYSSISLNGKTLHYKDQQKGVIHIGDIQKISLWIRTFDGNCIYF